MKNIKKIVAAAATLIMGVWAGNTANAANAAADTIAEYGGDYAVMNRWPVTQRDVGGTLLFSDSPEYVNKNGILYRDTVTGNVRVLYYHLNDTNAPKKIASEAATVTITRRATATPNKYFLHVGKSVQKNYFADNRKEILTIEANHGQLLDKSMGKTIIRPGELVYGVYDFSVNRPVKVSVLMCDKKDNPAEFVKIAKVLPKDEQRLRGTFKGADRIMTAVKSYEPTKDGIVFVPIGDNEFDRYKRGIDATDGSEAVNYGNYGVLYRIYLPIREKSKAQLYLSPLGGVYAGAVNAVSGLKKQLIKTPAIGFFGDNMSSSARDTVYKYAQKGQFVISKFHELADLGVYGGDKTLMFEYSPPGASNLPAHIVIMPAK